MGDSAGGGFALAMAITARAIGLPRASRIILFSPWLDLSLKDPAALSIEPKDVMLGVDALRMCGEWWAGDLATSNPVLSPLADIKAWSLRRKLLGSD